MKTVHILANNAPIVGYALAPLRHNRDRLRESGYAIKVFHKSSDECLSCNVLCLISKPTFRLVKEREPVCNESGPIVRFLRRARRSADRIIWMDNSDSTGVTHFELLPYVDRYLKKQLFRDRSLYQKEFYGGRIFSDFYHRRFGIRDDEPFTQFHPLDPAMSDKVRLSWNIGFGDIYGAFGWKGRARRYVPGFAPAIYDFPFCDSRRGRPVDLFLRTTAELGRPSVSFHRHEMLRRLAGYMGDRPTLSGMIGDGVSTGSEAASRLLPRNGGRLPTRSYRAILSGTKIMPSPFGWGELGARDYEAFIFGAALVKPDMAHMETWPNLFVRGETYQPIDWDFSNLQAVLDNLLANNAARRRISVNGQDAYRDSISPAGMERFCEWFIRQIGD